MYILIATRYIRIYLSETLLAFSHKLLFLFGDNETKSCVSLLPGPELRFDSLIEGAENDRCLSNWVTASGLLVTANR